MTQESRVCHQYCGSMRILESNICSVSGKHHDPVMPGMSTNEDTDIMTCHSATSKQAGNIGYLGMGVGRDYHH